MTPTVTLTALPDTAKPHTPQHGLLRLSPSLTIPVFAEPEGCTLSEAVAVVFRDGSGTPIHGGLFGIAATGIVKVVLIDEARGINTDDDPAWTAFGLSMTVGKLRITGASGTRRLPWSIVDFGMDNIHAEDRHPTAARAAVREMYVREIVPTLAFIRRCRKSDALTKDRPKARFRSDGG